MIKTKPRSNYSIIFSIFSEANIWFNYALKIFIFFVGPISFIILVKIWLSEDIWEQYPNIRLEETSCSTWLKLKNNDCE